MGLDTRQPVGDSPHRQTMGEPSGQFVRRIWHVVMRRRRETDLAEEIALHHAMKADELRERGVGPADVDVATKRAMGN